MDESDFAMSAKDMAEDAILIALSGVIDYSNHLQLRELAVEAVGRGRVRQVVDLSAVRLCDSSGLATLVLMQRQAAQAGGWVRLVAPSALVLNVLTLTSLDRILEIRPTVESAVADR